MLRRPADPTWRDGLLAVALTVVAQVELALGADSVDGVLWWHQLSYLLILPAVTLRRRAPLLSILFAAAGLAVEPLVGPAPVATPYLVLLYLLASFGWYASTRVGLLGVTVVLLCGLLYDFTRQQILVADLVVNAVIIAMAWAAGRLVRISTDRRVRAELEADRAARDAVARERERIGRDLHDSMAHALTLITLQAGGARERTEQGVAVQAFGAIEEAGREALADMHRFLGLLGPGRDQGEAPGLGDLPDLVDGVRRGGLAVELDLCVDELPASVGTTVYRVVQEGLTNVIRHSEARRARVVVRREETSVLTTVTDDGRPRAPRTEGGGRGLAGLAERLSLFDGTLESARTDDGWCLEARIPLAGES